MSVNNQLIICKVKGEYCVFENLCVDNYFPNPRTNKNALYKTKELTSAIRWANKYSNEEMVEYGVSVRI